MTISEVYKSINLTEEERWSATIKIHCFSAMNPGMRMAMMAQAAGIPMTPTALAALQRQQAGLTGPPIMGEIATFLSNSLFSIL